MRLHSSALRRMGPVAAAQRRPSLPGAGGDGGRLRVSAGRGAPRPPGTHAGPRALRAAPVPACVSASTPPRTQRGPAPALASPERGVPQCSGGLKGSSSLARADAEAEEALRTSEGRKHVVTSQEFRTTTALTLTLEIRFCAKMGVTKEQMYKLLTITILFSVSTILTLVFAIQGTNYSSSCHFNFGQLLINSSEKYLEVELIHRLKCPPKRWY
ncbi:uncharacterized protein [Gorilla gorilla gorilla]|uniref:uncharacterized protein n=1 Tax=Gorilla gorilla gorilla TaxID=9595 RepID=UPI0030090570